MSTEEIRVYGNLAISLLNLLFTAGVWLYVRYGDRHKEIDRRLADLDARADRRADESDRRISRLEGLVERAPTHGDLSQIHEKLNATSALVNQMAGELKGVNENLRLILSQVAAKGMS